MKTIETHDGVVDILNVLGGHGVSIEKKGEPDYAASISRFIVEGVATDLKVGVF